MTTHDAHPAASLDSTALSPRAGARRGRATPWLRRQPAPRPPSPSASHAEIAPRRSGNADVASATDDATTPCAALPAEPPPGLALRVTQADLGPQVLTNRWRSGMIALDPAACAQLRPRLPADGCHRLAPDAFARLYGELRRGGIHRIRVRTSEPASPHRGGWALGVQWSGGACEVSDILGSIVVAADGAAFTALRDAVVAALIAAPVVPAQ